MARTERYVPISDSVNPSPPFEEGKGLGVGEKIMIFKKKKRCKKTKEIYLPESTGVNAKMG